MYTIYVDPWGEIADIDENTSEEEIRDIVEDFIWNEITWGIKDEEGEEVSILEFT